MSFTRATTIVSLVLLAVLGCAQSAMGAGWWCSKDRPLNVYEDGIVQGEAYGHFYNYGDGRAMSTAWYRDARPSGNPVRVETDFYWYSSNEVECGEAGTCFWHDVSKQTDKWYSRTWHKHARARYLNDAAWRSRGRIDICEVQAWSNDPCSSKAIETFDY